MTVAVKSPALAHRAPAKLPSIAPRTQAGHRRSATRPLLYGPVGFDLSRCNLQQEFAKRPARGLGIYTKALVWF